MSFFADDVVVTLATVGAGAVFASFPCTATSPSLQDCNHVHHDHIRKDLKNSEHIQIFKFYIKEKFLLMSQKLSINLVGLIFAVIYEKILLLYRHLAYM